MQMLLKKLGRSLFLLFFGLNLLGQENLPELGDEVLIFGSDKINTITMETIADAIDSTPYVIATDIKGRTLRKYRN